MRQINVTMKCMSGTGWRAISYVSAWTALEYCGDDDDNDDDNSDDGESRTNALK